MKKIISILLCVLIIVSLFTIAPSFANATSTDIVETGATSGKCGENVTWSFDNSTGKLEISGSGKMYDNWEGDESIMWPWYAFRNKIKDIAILDGVTDIGEYAFYAYSNISSVSISESVTSIGEDAFDGCSNISEILIPDNLKFDEDAFDNCTGLRRITVNNSNPNYTSVDGILFNKNKTELIFCPENAEITEYIVPDTVNKICFCAFEGCINLKKVSIPNSVTSIENYAFSGCKSLTSITISNSVTSIGKGAFYGCESLASVMIPDSVTRIENYAFSECKSLTSITISNSVTSIGESAFYGCESLASVMISDSLTTISYSTFSGCKSLTSVTIPDSVTSIGEYAFLGCESLTSVTIPDSVTSIDEGAFSGCVSLTSVTIPDSVKSIGGYTFFRCESLTSVTIPDSVTRIESSVFYRCISLTSITIPNSVTYIDSYAFENCISLENVIIPESITTLQNGAFRNCIGLTSISIPETIKCIGTSAFENCIALQDIDIPDRGIYFGFSAFNNTAFYNNELNWDNNVLYVGNHLVCAENMNSENYTIKEGTKSIANYAFSGCSNLKELTIPKSVIKIDYDAFSNCDNNRVIIKVINYKGTSQEWEKVGFYSGDFNVVCSDTTISLRTSKATLYVKGTTTIKPTVMNGIGKTTYKSSNPNVARVYSNGKVVALKAGTAKITVTNNKVSKVFTVKVLNPKLNKTSVSISRGKSYTLKITGKIGTAKFYTSNKKIATVNSKGKITVNKKAKKGSTVTITVKTNGITLKCKVKVK